MRILRTFGAYLASVVAAILAAVGFISQRIIAEQTAVGGEYTGAEQVNAFVLNLPGLVSGGYGAALAVALLIGFGVAALVKRILKPLAPIAYPLAGAAAVIGVILIINQFLAPPGVGGAIPGARSGLELALQGVAGAFGGLVFALLRPKPR